MSDDRQWWFAVDSLVATEEIGAGVERVLCEVFDAYFAPALISPGRPQGLHVLFETVTVAGERKARFSEKAWVAAVERARSGDLSGLHLSVGLDPWPGRASISLLVMQSSAELGDPPRTVCTFHVTPGAIPGVEDTDRLETDVPAMARRFAIGFRAETGGVDRGEYPRGGDSSSTGVVEPLPRALGTYWGTFLGPERLSAAGGKDRLLSDPPAFIAMDLSLPGHELVYVQLSAVSTERSEEDERRLADYLGLLSPPGSPETSASAPSGEMEAFASVLREMQDVGTGDAPLTGPRLSVRPL